MAGAEEIELDPTSILSVLDRGRVMSPIVSTENGVRQDRKRKAPCRHFTMKQAHHST